MTQQQVADRLCEMGLKYTRESVQRVETGHQIPKEPTLDAMVRILGAPDLTSMLDRTPDEAEEYRQIAALDPKERRRMLKWWKSAHATEDAE